MAALAPNIGIRTSTKYTKTKEMKAEEMLNKHCNIEFDKLTGEKMVVSSESSVIIAMEEFANQQANERHDKAFEYFHNLILPKDYTEIPFAKTASLSHSEIHKLIQIASEYEE